MVKRYFILFIVIIVSLPSMAWAHRVIVFAWVDGNRIQVEAGFSAKRPCKNAPVRVFNKKGDVILKGQTDAQGIFAFPLENIPRTDLRIRVDAGPGHAGEWQLSQSEIAGPNTAVASKMRNKSPSMGKIIMGIAGIFILFMGAQKFIVSPKRKGPHDRG